MPSQPTGTISRRRKQPEPGSSLRIAGPGVSLSQSGGRRRATRDVVNPGVNRPTTFSGGRLRLGDMRAPSVDTRTTVTAAPQLPMETTFTPPPSATETTPPVSAPLASPAELKPGEFDAATPANFKPSLRTGSRLNRPAVNAATNALEQTVANGKTLAQERVEPVLNAEQAAAAKQRAVAGGDRLRRSFRSPKDVAEDRRQETLGLRNRRLDVDQAGVQAGVDIAAGQVAGAENVARIRGQADVDVAKEGGAPRSRRRVVQNPTFDANGQRTGSENVIVDPEAGTEFFPEGVDAQGNPTPFEPPPPVNTDSYQSLLDSLDDANVAGYQAGDYKGDDDKAIKLLDDAWIALGLPLDDAPHRGGPGVQDASPVGTVDKPQPFKSLGEAEKAGLPQGAIIVTPDGTKYRME